MTNTHVRRIAALVAVPALLLTAAACGSDSHGSGSGGSGGSPAVAVATVSGKFGAKPGITFPKGDPGSTTMVKVITAGTAGPAVANGDVARLDIEAESWKDGRDLGSTWSQQAGGERRQDVETIGQQSQTMPAKVLAALNGKKAGTRVLVQGTAADLVGQINPQSGISASDTLVYVVDVAAVGPVNTKATAQGPQAAAEPGLPAVQAPAGKAAVITIPKGVKAPSKLEQQVLIHGRGPVVKAGQALIAQYTGALWSNGKVFDSSWKHGGAIAFQIGTASVVPGWDQTLVGKHVGDRVLMVLPPALAYGAQGSPPSVPANATLVFSVDIVGVV